MGRSLALSNWLNLTFHPSLWDLLTCATLVCSPCPISTPPCVTSTVPSAGRAGTCGSDGSAQCVYRCASLGPAWFGSRNAACTTPPYPPALTQTPTCCWLPTTHPTPPQPSPATSIDLTTHLCRCAPERPPG